jgi:hypothetical protein
MRKGECTQASVTFSPHGLPSLDALIGGEEGSPPISPITPSLGSLLGGKEGSPGNLSNHHINLDLVHCDFDIIKVSQDPLIVLFLGAHHQGDTWVSPCFNFPRATYLDNYWVPLYYCFPLSSWTLIGKLEQSTLPIGILQWESGESENGEQVSGEQYFYNIATPTTIQTTVPKEVTMQWSYDVINYVHHVDYSIKGSDTILSAIIARVYAYVTIIARVYAYVTTNVTCINKFLSCVAKIQIAQQESQICWKIRSFTPILSAPKSIHVDDVSLVDDVSYVI